MVVGKGAACTGDTGACLEPELDFRSLEDVLGSLSTPGDRDREASPAAGGVEMGDEPEKKACENK